MHAPRVAPGARVAGLRLDASRAASHVPWRRGAAHVCDGATHNASSAGPVQFMSEEETSVSGGGQQCETRLGKSGFVPEKRDVF